MSYKFLSFAAETAPEIAKYLDEEVNDLINKGYILECVTHLIANLDQDKKLNYKHIVHVRLKK